MLKRIVIRSYEVGLKFRDGEFKGLIGAGTHWIFDPLNKLRVRVVSKRDAWLVDDQLDVIVKSGALAEKAEVLDLKDYQRALVWIDGRFARILGAGLYAYWTGVREVRVEVVDSRDVRFEHKDLKSIVRAAEALAGLRVGRRLHREQRRDVLVGVERDHAVVDRVCSREQRGLDRLGFADHERPRQRGQHLSDQGRAAARHVEHETVRLQSGTQPLRFE